MPPRDAARAPTAHPQPYTQTARMSGMTRQGGADMGQLYRQPFPSQSQGPFAGSGDFDGLGELSMDGDNQWSQPAARRRMPSDDMYAPAAFDQSTSSFPPAKKARTADAPSRMESESADDATAAAGAGASKRNDSAKPKSKKGKAQEDEGDEGSKAGESEYPSVLTREKKQKACANCRKAKLKCIMDDGETVCVRCKARSEKCVFYPRNQEDDWQATVASDLYQAISHLSDLSSAVHHMIHHLTDRGFIPPLPTPLERYTAPDRDGSIVQQGWTAEHNRQLPGPNDRRNKRDRRPSSPEKQPKRQDQQAEPFTGMEAGTDAMTAWAMEQPRLWNDNLGGPADNMPVVNTIPQNALPMPPSPERPAQRPLISPPTSLRGDSIPVPSTNFTTPEISQIMVSPRMGTQTIGAGPSFPSAQYNTAIFMESNDMAGPSEAGLLASLNIIPGSDDSRQDVIKKGLVDARDAVVLLNYFHQNLGKMVYGYRLEFGRFPYLPAGPTTITPLILAVQCLVSAERLSHLSYYRAALYGAVKTLLLESPAESWQRLASSNAKNPEGVNGEDELDPELGIGPEEIVAAALLSMWIAGKNDAIWIADIAFKWARGWIRLLTGPPRNSIAEIAGIVPAERVASQAEMARVWLLCYLTEGSQAILQPENHARGREPEDFCRVILAQGRNDGGIGADPHDTILIENARTMYVYRQYLHERSLLAQQPISDQRHRELQRLVSRTDSKLQSMRDALEIVHLPDHWLAYKQLELFSLQARVMVHHLAIKMDLPARQRGASMGICMDVSMEFLEKCGKWRPKEELTNAPQACLTGISMISRIVYDNICESVQTPGAAGTFVTAAEAWPIFATLGDMLHLGSLSQNHASRLIGDGLQQQASGLRRLAENGAGYGGLSMASGSGNGAFRGVIQS